MILEDLHTNRLRFRILQEKDLPDLLGFFNDPIATQFLSINDGIESFTETWFRRQLRRYEIGHWRSPRCRIPTNRGIDRSMRPRPAVRGRHTKWEVGYHIFRRFWAMALPQRLLRRAVIFV